MRNIRFGTNVTVFLLFFALALIDAIASRDWLRATFWFAIGLFFLWFDIPKRAARTGAW